jgi:hypothetical protein
MDGVASGEVNGAFGEKPGSDYHKASGENHPVF